MVGLSVSNRTLHVESTAVLIGWKYERMAGHDGERPDLDDILTWNFVRSARLIGGRLAGRLGELELNPVHFGVLAFLDRDDEMTSAEIARAVLVRPQSIAPLLDGLESRGLVTRTGARTRGQRNPVRITTDGRAALHAAWVIALEANDLRDVGLDASESAELNRLLLKIVRSS
ncbi:DNA-binding MarR family transcriptional regulator [Frigoribacterium sp. PhB160]|uniref:MarR family winged helix-turn-helix transcriptional regulator n=1 Tax=Frigoribacterium sp. PhB160 TaxID=2485192 RepID=UPI000FA7AD7B|nr:MarR family winged helix-turn-helix transcriptional regulator [Frigoribacterium sp. PhB160]ROS61185.1 DNA-binding MarR family transcriptional regulator [Frigoribacterium sp. PhB160]